MIFFLHGEDPYRSRQKLNLIKNRFTKTDKSNMNLVVLDGAKIAYKDLKKELTVAPFLHDKKLIIIENLLGGNKQKKIFDEITDLIKQDSIPDFIFAIFWESGKVDARKSLYKILQKKAQVEKFEPLVGTQINQWIIKEVEKKGGAIDPPAINQLAVFVGNDLWQMSTEIDKLIAYNRQITLENINLLVNAKIDDNIFQIMDAISTKNKKLALQLIKKQFTDIGSDFGYLLNMMVRQFRILISVKSFAENGNTNKQQVASALKIHPFVAQKTLAQIQNFEMQKLKIIYNKLMDIEYRMKTSSSSPEVLLDLLVVSL